MGSNNKEPNSNLHRNNLDIAQKAFFMQFAPGTKPLTGLDYDTVPIKAVLPTGIQAVETKDDEADQLFRLEDDSLLHIEFQSSYNKWDAIRFAKYHLHFYDLYKNELEHVLPGKRIKTIVIFSNHLKDEGPKTIINTGGLQFQMDTIVVTEQEREKDIEEIKKKVKKQSSVVLSKKEEQLLVYSPFMGEKSGLKGRAILASKILAQMDDNLQKFRLLGTLIAFTKNRLDKVTLDKLWEVFELSTVYEEFVQEKMEKEYQKRMNKERFEIKEEMVIRFLNSDKANNKSGEFIKEVFDITQEELDSINEKLKKK